MIPTYLTVADVARLEPRTEDTPYGDVRYFPFSIRLCGGYRHGAEIENFEVPREMLDWIARLPPQEAVVVVYRTQRSWDDEPFNEDPSGFAEFKKAALMEPYELCVASDGAKQWLVLVEKGLSQAKKMRAVKNAFGGELMVPGTEPIGSAAKSFTKRLADASAKLREAHRKAAGPEDEE